jgi:hypothetical protein
VIDEAGAPAQAGLTFPAAPSALAASGFHVLAACADGVHVYDRTSAAWVQRLTWPDGLRTAPGQQLCAAANPRGSVVLVAGYRRVRATVALTPSVPDSCMAAAPACSYTGAER